MEHFDKIIIGAGIYGLYSALFCARKGEHVLVLEGDTSAFSRATYINQARVHQGYHYPRSLSTALKSAGYFTRFNKDYNFCINGQFEKVYATSSRYSMSNREQFKTFCKAAEIPCQELHVNQFFKEGMCDGAFLTREYTYDAMILKSYFLTELEKFTNIKIMFSTLVTELSIENDAYVVKTSTGLKLCTGFLLNATYASTNQIAQLLDFDTFKIKYELCEIILCRVNNELKQYGLTVMDGPFFSIMPFGKAPWHSLTSVTFTPHSTSYDAVPNFPCQSHSSGYCSTKHLGNCNLCSAKPPTAFPYMANLARKYLQDKFQFEYEKSLFSMKPILMTSEVDDSRPTVIRKLSSNPTFVSVLSGKVNTVYDLDEVLSDD